MIGVTDASSHETIRECSVRVVSALRASRFTFSSTYSPAARLAQSTVKTKVFCVVIVASVCSVVTVAVWEPLDSWVIAMCYSQRTIASRGTREFAEVLEHCALTATRLPAGIGVQIGPSGKPLRSARNASVAPAAFAKITCSLLAAPMPTSMK